MAPKLFNLLLIIVSCYITATLSAIGNQTLSGFSIDNVMFPIYSNQTEIQCGNSLLIDDDVQISYKVFIDSSTEPSGTITVCPRTATANTNATETYLYLTKLVGTQQDLVSHIESVAVRDPAICNGSVYGAQLDLSPLVDQHLFGTYFIFIENEFFDSFSLHMDCQSTSGLNDVTILIIVLSVVAVCVAIFCTFYYLQIKRVQKMQTVRRVKQDPDDHSVTTDDDEHQIAVEVYDDGQITTVGDEHSETAEFRPQQQPHINAADDEDIADDPIIAVMQDAIKSVADGELDIYQVLAFRKNNRRSRRMKVKKPLSKFRINLNILYLSSYQRAFYVAMTVFSLQVIGITVILYSVTIAKQDQFACFWDVRDWQDHSNWIYKILAFLWASVITINIGINQKRIRESGLYKIVDQVPNEMYSLLDCVDIVLLHVGLLCNLYTLFIASIGSFFIVKSSSGGAESLDMVLNAVALFFMIDLDDMLVTNGDYRDVENGCQEYLGNYSRERRESLHLPQIESRDRLMIQDNAALPRGQLCGIKGMSRLTKCVEMFGYAIAGLTVILGFIAPIWILICYSAF